MHFSRDDSKGGIRTSKIEASRSQHNREFFGRSAAVGYEVVGMASTSPEGPLISFESCMILRANANQETSSGPQIWVIPANLLSQWFDNTLRAISTIANARSGAKVGQPIWSSTTVSLSRSLESRSIVLTKLFPKGA